MTIVAAIIGLYMTACTLIITVWGFQRLVTRRRPNLQILALEERIMQLEVAVADARRQLQPTPTMVPPQDHIEHNWIAVSSAANGELWRTCYDCGAREEYFQWPTN
jgi:hypothetical protein